jgi:naphthoate synthase
MAGKLLRKLPECTRYTKQQLNFWKDLSWAMTIGNVKDWLTVHTGAPEIRMSIDAFMRKQPLDYESIRRMNAGSVQNSGTSKRTKGKRKPNGE